MNRRAISSHDFMSTPVSFSNMARRGIESFAWRKIDILPMPHSWFDAPQRKAGKNHHGHGDLLLGSSCTVLHIRDRLTRSQARQKVGRSATRACTITGKDCRPPLGGNAVALPPFGDGGRIGTEIGAHGFF